MPGTESPNKLCVVCGKDVAGKPRVKDAAGRYTCVGDCQQKHVESMKQSVVPAKGAGTASAGGASKSASVSAASVPRSDEGSMLNDLISQSPMLKAGKCEQCGSIMPQGGVICTRCGFNTKTGKSVRTAVFVDKEKKTSKSAEAASEAGSKVMAVLRSPIIFGSMIAIGLGVVGFVGVQVPEFTLVAFSIVGIVYLVSIIWGLIDACQEQEYTWAGLMIYHVIGGFIPFGILRFGSIIGFFATVGYIVFVCDRPVLKSMYIGSFLAFAGSALGLYMSRGGFNFN